MWFYPLTFKKEQRGGYVAVPFSSWIASKLFSGHCLDLYRSHGPHAGKHGVPARCYRDAAFPGDQGAFAGSQTGGICSRVTRSFVT